ncbi:MAG TPA: stage 0 sporulation family protein [Armatimonadota bacterium]|nr:stage 0 sporulation family protein [Armatimonadota bacterium]
MPIVVGISLRTAGKIYYFDPGDEHYCHGERVLVETARGPELGTVKVTPREVAEEQIVPPLKPVVRRATAADITRDSLNREREEHAVDVCKRLVDKLNLPMRLIGAQYTLDGSHVLIFFLSENRVDFRELVRELAHELHSRIELRQVGVRDEAKLLGGYGICGRKLCCSAFLDNFAPVAISMAKDQGLALNPQKISGNCGRLMCCLAFECDQYRTERADLPKLNATLETSRGVGKVTKLNVLSRQIEVTIPELPAPLWFSFDDLTNELPATACGTQHASGHSGCGKCCHGATTEPENHPTVAVSEELIEETLAAPTAQPFVEPVVEAPAAEAMAEPAVKPARRRRRRPAAQRDHQQQTATPKQASEDPQPAKEGQQSTKRRQRRRKPKTAAANPDTKPTPVLVAVQSSGNDQVQNAGKPPVSGRYRPRRRHQSGKGNTNKPSAE